MGGAENSNDKLIRKEIPDRCQIRRTHTSGTLREELKIKMIN
jgi:hypothetical protein